MKKALGILKNGISVVPLSRCPGFLASAKGHSLVGLPGPGTGPPRYGRATKDQPLPTRLGKGVLRLLELDE